MCDAVHEVMQEASWKLASILRAATYFSAEDIIGLYKSKVLSYIEFRTPAIYHACSSAAEPLDKLQQRFLSDVGITETEALLIFNLAPLQARRDIAMLGVIHRRNVGKGPAHFQKHFKPAEDGAATILTRLAARRHDR